MSIQLSPQYPCLKTFKQQHSDSHQKKEKLRTKKSIAYCEMNVKTDDLSFEEYTLFINGLSIQNIKQRREYNPCDEMNCSVGTFENKSHRSSHCFEDSYFDEDVNSILDVELNDYYNNTYVYAYQYDAYQRDALGVDIKY